MSDERRASSRRTGTFRRFLSYYGPQRHLFVGDMACALLVAAIDLAFPQILRTLTNGLFAGPAAEIYRALLVLLIGLLAMYAVRYACRYFVGAWGHVMGARMESRMRADLFAQYERFSFSWFDRVKTGDMMSRVVNDLFDIAEAAHHGPENIVISGIEIVGMLVIMMLINWQLALAVAIVTAVLVAYLVRRNRTLRATIRDNRLKMSGINAQLEDSLAGMRVVKSFAAEEVERRKFEASNDAYLASKERTYRAMGTFTAASSTMSGMLYTVVIVLGGYLVASGRMAVGDLAIFALYIGILSTPIETLINFTETFQKAVAGFHRFCEILDTKPDVQDRPGAQDLRVTRGEITFDDVSFSYDGTHDVLDHLSLRVPAGATVALVGPSGGGKTTTCSLVPRFYDVTAGAVTVDGVDVRDLRQHDLRAQLGYVPQKAFLFSGTIASNIAYGAPGASPERVAEAARVAQAADFIAERPEGAGAPIAQGGTNVSGGQRQRLAIARALATDARAYLFDDSFSALDYRTDAALRQALATEMRGRTVLIVAQRIATVLHADVIVVLDEGRVVGTGTHAELMRDCPQYREIALSQLSEAELAAAAGVADGAGRGTAAAADGAGEKGGDAR